MSTEEAAGSVKNAETNDDSDSQKTELESVKNDVSNSGYCDYSNEPPDENKSRIPKDPSHTFPMKLHSILANNEFQDIIAWLPHGRSWRILQHKAFEERVIPMYFRHGRYSSFARQVNGWGFRRITNGPDYNAYYHPRFLRGLVHVSTKMKRLTSRDLKSSQVAAEQALPDFYAFSKDHPLPDPKKNPVANGRSVVAPSQALASPMLLPAAAFGGFNLAALSALCAQQQASAVPVSATPASAEQQRNDLLRMMGLVAQPVVPAAAPQQPPAAAPAVAAVPQLDIQSTSFELWRKPCPSYPTCGYSGCGRTPACSSCAYGCCPCPAIPAGLNLAALPALMAAFQQQQQATSSTTPMAAPAPVPAIDLTRLLAMATTPQSVVNSPAAAPPTGAPAAAPLQFNPLMLLQQLQQQQQSQPQVAAAPQPAETTTTTEAPAAAALVDALRQVEALKQQLGPTSTGGLASLDAKSAPGTKEAKS